MEVRCIMATALCQEVQAPILALTVLSRTMCAISVSNGVSNIIFEWPIRYVPFGISNKEPKDSLNQKSKTYLN